MPNLKLFKSKKRKTGIAAQERAVAAAQRMSARMRARRRGDNKTATPPPPPAAARPMDVESVSSVSLRGIKRKASADSPSPPYERPWSPPPIESGASAETLHVFGAALGRDALAAELLWLGLSDADRALWPAVEEYVLWLRRYDDAPPDDRRPHSRPPHALPFPAVHVEDFIAFKAREQYKNTRTIDAHTLTDLADKLADWHRVMGHKDGRLRSRQTDRVIAGALKAWGDSGTSR